MRKYGLIKLGLAAVMLTSVSAASEGADVSSGPAYLPPASPIPFVYNMMDFGNSGPFTDNKFNILKAGINYRFGAPGWHF